MNIPVGKFRVNIRLLAKFKFPAQTKLVTIKHFLLNFLMAISAYILKIIEKEPF